VFGGEGSGEEPIDHAPLTTVRVAGDPLDPLAYAIDIGSVTAIGADGIVLNAGCDLAGNPLLLDIVTTSGALRLNGAVGLWSNVLIDTTDGGNSSGARSRFTQSASIDSQAGERSDLILAAGDAGAVSFNRDIGATEALAS